jgi:cyclohexyl-isocyanide hydratase
MTQSLHIGLVLFPRLTQLDLTGPYEVLARIPGVTVHLVAASLAPVVSEHGLAITPTVAFDDAPPFDLLCVPGGLGVDPMMEDPVLLSFLKRQAEQARYVTSVCTGSLLLGAAGLLQGYKATTHWMALPFLAAFGAEAVDERVVVDRNRITGSGITAGMDFGLTVAAEVAGPTVAQAIQLVLEYDPKPPFASGSPRTAPPAIVERVKQARQAHQAERTAIVERASAPWRSSARRP